MRRAPTKPTLIIKAGVPIPKGFAEKTASLRQKLDDAICIGVNKSDSISSFKNVRFLQFITRQCPSEFALNFEQRVEWDTQESHYMADGVTPRWRTDSASHPNPFYEADGVHLDTEDALCIYDQPAYAFEPNERIIGCTFVIINDQVCQEIRWSRQYEYIDSEHVSTYHTSTHEIDLLPEWAIYTLMDEYESNDFNSKSEKKIYKIPEFLVRKLTMDPEAALLKAKQSVIPHSPRWALKYDERFKQLVPKTSTPTHGLFCTTLVSREEAKEWERVMSSQPKASTDDKSGPGYGF